MKKLIAIILTVMLIVSAVPLTASAQSAKPQQNPFQKTEKTEIYAKGEALVMLKDGTMSGEAAAKNFKGLSGVTIEEIIEFKDEKVSAKSGLTQKEAVMTVMNVSSKSYSTEQLIAMFSKRPDVKYAEPNYTCKTTSLTNDTYSDYQWALKNIGQNGGTDGMDINIQDIWSQKTDTNKVIAVIDTGIDYMHEDLKDRMWINTNTRVLAGKHGYDFYYGDDLPMDDNGHGSHCAGVIAAQSDNSKGISGVNKDAKLMALKFLDSMGDGYLDDVISCYNYIYRAQNLGVNVVAINNSWGSEGYDSRIFEEVMNKVGARGAISVCAAGNESVDSDKVVSVPGCTDSPYCINVAATNEDGELATFSNYGENSVDIAAPGTTILSSVSTNTFNPTIYDNKSAMTDYFTNFSDMQTFPLSGGEYYWDFSYYDDSTATSTQSVSSNEFFGIKGAGEKSLEWSVTGAEMGDMYGLVFPYDSKVSSKPINISTAVKISSAPKATEFYGASCFVVISDIALNSDGSIPRSFDVFWDFVDYTGSYESQNFWEHISGVAQEKSNVGKRAVIVTLAAEVDGDFKINLDDIGVSKAELDPESFGKYDFYSGTSMACPMVTGAVALVSEVNPTYSPEELCATVIDMAKPNTGLTDKVASGGILDMSLYAVKKPHITSAVINSAGNITLSGMNFTDVKGTVKANGAEIPAGNVTWGAKSITIPGSGLVNKVVKFEVTNPNGTAKYNSYMVKGKKQFTLLKNMAFPDGDIFTDGKSLYGVTGGDFYRYEEYQEEEYDSFNGNNGDDDYYVGGWMPLGCVDLAKFFPKLSEDDFRTSDFQLISAPVYLDGRFYFAGLLDAGYAKDYCFGAYNPEKDIWYNLGTYPSDGEFANLTDSSLAVYNAKIYLLGGLDINTYLPSTAVRVYDPAKKTWSKGVSMPEGRFLGQAQQTGNKLVVALGGNATGSSPKTLVFDGKTWTTGRALAAPLYHKSLLFKSDTETDYQMGEDYNGNPIYYNEFKYYKAAMGITKSGLIFTGLPVDGLGDTFYYDLTSNTFKSLAYQFSDKIDSTYEITGTSLGGEFYVGKYEAPYYSDDYYDDYSGEYIDAQLFQVPISSGMLKVTGSGSGGYISGAQSYLPGQTVTLKAMPNSGYTFKSLKVDGKAVSGNSYTFVIDKNVAAVATFTKNPPKPAVYNYITMKIGSKKAIVNDKKTTIDSQGTKPTILNGKTVIPVRFVSEKMKAKVRYSSDKDPIIIIYRDTTVELKLGSKKMTVITSTGTRKITLETAPQKIDGKTFVPLRALGEALGFGIFYDNASRIIIVSNPPMPSSVRKTKLNEGKTFF